MAPALRLGVLLAAALCLPPLPAAGPERAPDVRDPLTTRLLHEQGQRARSRAAALRQNTGRADALALPGIGDIAIVDDGEGVRLPPLPFDLDGRSVAITPLDPAASSYSYQTREGGFDPEAAAAGELTPLADDDSVTLELPFAFPYFGEPRRRAFLNSDGNLTFDRPDTATTLRSPARLVAQPRIAPYFADLDPSQPDAVTLVLSEPERVVVTWFNVPEFRFEGLGPTQTFQLKLYADGRLEFSYDGITGETSIVGIAPGRRFNDSQVVDFSEPPGEPQTAAFVEIFLPADLDLATIAQKFYLTHEDAYDFLVIFHNYDIGVNTPAFALYAGIRNFVRGIGPAPLGFEEQNLFDFGRLLGSSYRLQGLMFMGELAKYPDDPNGRISRNFGLGVSTPLTVLAHEAGHRWLARPLFVDRQASQLSAELLGRQFSHWSYFFNSEASFLEGNRIADHGAGPFRFETVETIEGFSPLDLYLMGLAPAAGTPPSFVVRNPSIRDELFSPGHEPLAGVFFDGERVDVAVDDIIAAHGRRIPDWTLSQKEFRYAFVLLIEEGSEPTAEDIEKVDRFRRAFEEYFERKTGGRASTRTHLARSLGLSVWPALGVLEGASLPAAVFIGRPTPAPLRVRLRAGADNIRAPDEVVIPAETRFAEFPIEGVRKGVSELTAEIDERFETITARIQVQDRRELSPQRIFLLELLFNDPRERLRTGEIGNPLPYPLLFQVIDDNLLPYEGVTVRLQASGDGFATPAEAVTDPLGLISAEWTLATQRGENTLTVSIPGSGRPPLVISAIGTIAPPRHRNLRRELFGP